jgi:uncharacterized membrane protein
MLKPMRAFAGDQRGSVAVLTALSCIVIIGVAALAIDVGKVFVDRRKAQATADLAAIAAASDLTNAMLAARATTGQNSYPTNTPLAVELGTYTADPAVAARNRFTPSAAANANAARVTLQTQSPLFLGRALAGTDNFAITTVATAANTALASFAIGSRLVAVDGGLLNQILGGLLGANLSLSVMDYQSLVDARIDLFDFMNALATRAQVTGPTYDSIASANAKVGDVVNAMADAQRIASGASTATRVLSDVASALNGSTSRLPVGSLANIGPYRTLPLGQKPQAGVSVSALDLLNATAQIANGQHQIEVGLNLNLPGIAGATLKLAVGERPVGASWMTVGPQGASVHTAQTRLLLTVRLLGSGSVASVNLPIYIELASATATLTSVSCRYNNPSASTATIGARPAVVDAWIGAVSDTEFNNFTRAPNPGNATLVETLLLRVTGRAHATVTNLADKSLTFTQSDIAQRVKKTIGTENFLASLLSRLTGDLSLNVNILGLGLGLPGVISQTVSGIVSSAATPIDSLLSSVLTTAGVGLGQADVWVTGVRCDGAVLVN